MTTLFGMKFKLNTWPNGSFHLTHSDALNGDIDLVLYSDAVHEYKYNKNGDEIFEEVDLLEFLNNLEKRCNTAEANATERIWTNNKFEGYWPVGTAAVVIADTAEKAAGYLNFLLCERGLGKAKAEDMIEMEFEDGRVRILCDGNY